MHKFGFSVITRDGLKVEGIQIYGKDLADAERKLRQMYTHCQVTQSKAIDNTRELLASADIDSVLSLLISQN